jgi:uncharacterized caspase-like protein
MKTTTWVTFCLLLTAAFSVHAETRVALVIGNGAYQHAPHLRNPVQDARAIAAALASVGYSVQPVVLDASKAQMEAALTQFARVAVGADQAVLFYSGHGIEVGGVNYLLPVEASVVSETTVPLEAISLPTVMGIASRARHLGLVVLDACRNNPLANSMERAAGSKAAMRGLSRVEPTGNLLVAYATREGQVAADDSPYAAAILDALKVPGLEVRQFWGRVRAADGARRCCWRSGASPGSRCGPQVLELAAAHRPPGAPSATVLRPVIEPAPEYPDHAPSLPAP